MSQEKNLVVILTERLKFIDEKDRLSLELIESLKKLKKILKTYSKICAKYENVRDKKLPNKFEKTDISEIYGTIEIVNQSIKRVDFEKDEKEFQQKVETTKQMLNYFKRLQKEGKNIELVEPFEEFSSINSNLEKTKEIEKYVINDLNISIKQTKSAVELYTKIVTNITLALNGKISFEQAENIDEKQFNLTI